MKDIQQQELVPPATVFSNTMTALLNAAIMHIYLRCSPAPKGLPSSQVVIIQACWLNSQSRIVFCQRAAGGWTPVPGLMIALQGYIRYGTGYKNKHYTQQPMGHLYSLGAMGQKYKPLNMKSICPDQSGRIKVN